MLMLLGKSYRTGGYRALASLEHESLEFSRPLLFDLSKGLRVNYKGSTLRIPSAL